MTRLHAAIANLAPVAHFLGWLAVICITIAGLWFIAWGGIFWCQQTLAWLRDLSPRRRRRAQVIDLSARLRPFDQRRGGVA